MFPFPFFRHFIDVTRARFFEVELFIGTAVFLSDAGSGQGLKRAENDAATT